MRLARYKSQLASEHQHKVENTPTVNHKVVNPPPSPPANQKIGLAANQHMVENTRRQPNNG